jgi:hypothetical protein
MTETTIRARIGITGRLSVWIRRCQREVSTRIYTAGDDHARRYGWTVTETTERFGFEARNYRDPRFNDRCGQLAPKADVLGICSDAAPTEPTGE